MKNKLAALIKWVKETKEFYKSDIYMREIHENKGAITKEQHLENVEKVREIVYSDENKQEKFMKSLY